MTYVSVVIYTIIAWFIGLVLDVNIDFRDLQGLLDLRVVLPILTMGICILKTIKESKIKY